LELYKQYFIARQHFIERPYHSNTTNSMCDVLRFYWVAITLGNWLEQIYWVERPYHSNTTNSLCDVLRFYWVAITLGNWLEQIYWVALM